MVTARWIAYRYVTRARCCDRSTIWFVHTVGEDRGDCASWTVLECSACEAEWNATVEDAHARRAVAA